MIAFLTETRTRAFLFASALMFTATAAHTTGHAGPHPAVRKVEVSAM